MPQVALNPQGGQATAVIARLADADIARVAELAAERGVARSAALRELVELGIEALDERENAGQR